jgi:hypothetical protein
MYSIVERAKLITPLPGSESHVFHQKFTVSPTWRTRLVFPHRVRCYSVQKHREEFRDEKGLLLSSTFSFIS